ncbi:MAG: kelch repeat-containing protein [Candidatus Dojkabacteria bacterium]
MFIFSSTHQVHATINNTINFQSRITNKTTGLAPATGSPACVSAGADTCDFRVRIWNVVSGGTATAGNNLLFEELFTNVEIGTGAGRFDLRINSVCVASASGTHSWASTVTSSTLCQLFDDNGDADSVTGVNFDRTDLFLEITFDPSGAWTTLASPPGGIETFTRTGLMSVPTVFSAQTLSGASTDGFVQLSPTTIQSTPSSTGAIRVNQQGSGNILQLQSSGTDKFVLNNAGQLALSQTGATGGLLLGDATLYRSAANTLKTDGGLTIALNLTADGLSNFKGDVRSLLTVGNGSTTTSGTGTTTKNLVVSSTTNFDVGNLVLVNGTTYARIDGVPTSTQLSVSPAVSWTTGQTVVEQIASKIGGDGATIAQQFDKIFINNALRVGIDSNGTYYGNGNITSSQGLSINSITGSQIDAYGYNNINILRGLNINKNLSSNVAASWSIGAGGGTGRAYSIGLVYNSKLYIWGGATNTALSTIVNTMNVYDLLTNTWATATAGGTARLAHTGQTYNGKMYYVTGCTNSALTSTTTVVDIYDVANNSWSTGASGGTARCQASSVIYNGKIYIWGGSANNSTNLNSVDIYDIGANSWTTGTTGGTARRSQTSVIYNGKMYNYGGFIAAVTNTLDIYDIPTATWSTGTAGGTARRNGSLFISNGNMLSVHGFTSSGVNTVDIYSLALGTWSTGTAGGTARYAQVAALYNGKIFEVDGLDSAGSNILSTTDIYDLGIRDTVLSINVGSEERLKLDTSNVLTITGKPLGLVYLTNENTQYTTRAWTVGATQTSTLNAPTGEIYQGKFYVYGGDATGGDKTMYIYNIASNTWSTGASSSVTHYEHMSALYNAQIYIWGGCDVAACASILNTMEIYNIATNTWSAGTTGGTARSGSSSVVYNGKWYLWGGCNSAGACPTVTNTMSIFDFGANTWTTGTTGGTARYGMGSTILNGKMYVLGGTIPGSGFSALFEIYDIQAATWSAGPSTGVVAGPTLFAYQDKVYLWGGYAGAGVLLNASYYYNIQTASWIQALPAGGTGRQGPAYGIYNGKFYTYGGQVAPYSSTRTDIDILDLGQTKAEDIFYIANQTGTGPATASQPDGKLFRFDATGRAYTSQQGGWFSVGADYAEYMHTNDTSIEAGDIVKLDETESKSILKAKEGDKAIVGVISTSPGFVGNITSVEDVNNNDPNWKLMSMVGQVPVKVKGDISIGDKITASDIEGVGKKAEDGETNIGIAQEPHTGEGISFISVMITRNNDGINNKVQINLGENGEAGFKLNEAGKVQFKNKEGEWTNLADSNQITQSLLWEQKGDNVFSLADTKVGIGVDQVDENGANLQVNKDIESKNGLNYIKVSSEGKILFGSTTDEIGFRINDISKTLEFRDSVSQEWRSLNGLVISRIRFDKDNQVDQPNQFQISGWGYMQSDGTYPLLSKTISFPIQYPYQPFVSVGIIGQSDTAPTKTSDCSDLSSVEKINVSEISSSSFKINLTTPVEIGKYYCYTWLAD